MEILFLHHLWRGIRGMMDGFSLFPAEHKESFFKKAILHLHLGFFESIIN